MATTWAKYFAVFRIALKNQWAYIGEAAVRSIFLVIIMYVFAQLWSTTYASTGNSVLAGYDVRSVVWYLAVTEAIVMGTPRLVSTLSEEIKQGDIAYRLTKPVNYVLYNYAQFLGEATVRVLLNLVIGASVAIAFFGFPNLSWVAVGTFVLAVLLAITMQFTLNMGISLLLFWIEDGKGLDLIASRMVMILGGMMIPLPLFPKWLADICLWLPFQVVAYLPANTLVNFRPEQIASELLRAGMWTLLFATACALLYRKGVRQLHVQGG